MDVFGGIRASKTMCAHCFHILEGKLKEWRPKVPKEEAEKLSKQEVHGMFVTYTNGEGGLRGCIGTFEKGGLGDTLKHFAVHAARDSRFAPVASHELDDLECSVTVLSEMKPIQRWDHWVVGTHGVYLSLSEGTKRYTATFLPSVIVDQCWSKHQTMEHLLAKAGWRGTPSPSVFERCTVYTYEGCKETLHYSEYKNAYKDAWGFAPL